MNFSDIEKSHDRAVASIQNIIPGCTSNEAEEAVNAIVSLVFSTIQQQLNEEMYDESSNH